MTRMTRDQLYDLLDEIKHQTRQRHVDASTWGVGPCGHFARGAGTCAECLYRRLAGVVGDDSANTYRKARDAHVAASVELERVEERLLESTKEKK